MICWTNLCGWNPIMNANRLMHRQFLNNIFFRILLNCSFAQACHTWQDIVSIYSKDEYMRRELEARTNMEPAHKRLKQDLQPSHANDQ